MRIQVTINITDNKSIHIRIQQQNETMFENVFQPKDVIYKMLEDRNRVDERI